MNETTTKHALLSPSAAHRWTVCPASVALCKDIEDEGSEYAREGTLAHYYASEYLNGRYENIDDDEMRECVQKYTTYIKESCGDRLGVEVRLSIEHITGEEGAEGTADYVGCIGDELVVVDLKYGRGVEVSAKENKQLMIYAHAALRQYSFLANFKTVRMCIYQPRTAGTCREWVISREDLEQRIAEIRNRATFVHEALSVDADLLDQWCQPDDQACRFCKVKGNCRALAEHAVKSIANDFEFDKPVRPQIEAKTNIKALVGNDKLGDLMRATDLVETWLKAVRARVESELLAGRSVDGFKLVVGREGIRKWDDVKAVEDAMKAARVKLNVMYETNLISPTAAEKLVKSGGIKPKLWDSLQDHVVQAAGKPSVAPTDDKREPYDLNSERAKVTDFI